MGITKCLQARATTTHDGTRKNKRTMPDKLQKLQKKTNKPACPITCIYGSARLKGCTTGQF